MNPLRVELWIGGKRRKVIYPELTNHLAIDMEVIRLKQQVAKEQEYQIFLIAPSKANTETQ